MPWISPPAEIAYYFGDDVSLSRMIPARKDIVINSYWEQNIPMFPVFSL